MSGQTKEGHWKGRRSQKRLEKRGKSMVKG
jgi:hypothetical protein